MQSHNQKTSRVILRNDKVNVAISEIQKAIEQQNYNILKPIDDVSGVVSQLFQYNEHQIQRQPHNDPWRFCKILNYLYQHNKTFLVHIDAAIYYDNQLYYVINGRRLDTVKYDENINFSSIFNKLELENLYYPLACLQTNWFIQYGNARLLPAIILEKQPEYNYQRLQLSYYSPQLRTKYLDMQFPDKNVIYTCNLDINYQDVMFAVLQQVVGHGIVVCHNISPSINKINGFDVSYCSWNQINTLNSNVFVVFASHKQEVQIRENILYYIFDPNDMCVVAPHANIEKMNFQPPQHNWQFVKCASLANLLQDSTILKQPRSVLIVANSAPVQNDLAMLKNNQKITYTNKYYLHPSNVRTIKHQIPIDIIIFDESSWQAFDNLQRHVYVPNNACIVALQQDDNATDYVKIQKDILTLEKYSNTQSTDFIDDNANQY